MKHEELERLVSLARDGGGFSITYGDEGPRIEVGEKTGKTNPDGSPEFMWHKLSPRDSFEFAMQSQRAYGREIEALWNELREAGLARPNLTLLQHLHSIIRSSDPETSRSQLVQDELLDHVVIGSGVMEETAEKLRRIATKLDETSEKLDDMPNDHGSTRPL